ncbi:aminoglycoside phosphotransferase family protein [Alkalihalobacillus sp. AL-G]|uniref:aminoglycoside phosphotransferase family protein n=1 Tax=Alkalihalobacillus sp. AL-G TaxID=2926399 RepID=UPI00272A5CAF|nr:aminoglycoside phosphotransferase family protein [Alkalihalobacillus sp. AL-G]WLD94261.1 aminoglycoside phosphotransferase family protein [Alkalihalobacillus sp. AL-G]
MSLEPYLKCIQSFYPDLKALFVEWNHTGQNNDILTLNNEWVFRFPKHDKALHSLQTECEQLVFLQPHISLPIPEPHFVNTDTDLLGQAFFGYQKIAGAPLYSEAVLESDSFEKQRLVTDLATFLNELHSIPTVDAPGKKVSGKQAFQYWMQLFSTIKEKLFPYMKLEKRFEVTGHFEAFLGDPSQFEFEPVLINGDFGVSNILYDYHFKRLSGIIDFGSCHIGDPAIDFAGLYKHFGEVFVKTMIPYYKDLEQFLPRIRFYAGTFALQEALYGHQFEDKEALENGLKEYV